MRIFPKRVVVSLLIAIVALLAVSGGIYFYKNRKVVVQPNTTLPETSWKTYSGKQFSLSYPADYGFLFNFCPGSCESTSTEGLSDSHVSVEIQNVGSSCDDGSCDVPVVGRQTFNDVVWDYLGFQTYSDVGQVSKFYEYRTITNGYVYRVMFNKDTPTNVQIMNTVVLNKEISSIYSLAESWVKMGKTYTDPFGFSMHYPDTWTVAKQPDGNLLIEINSPDTNTITIKEVSGPKVTDSNGKWGSVSYYFDETRGWWVRVGTNQYDGSPDGPSPMPVGQPRTLSGLFIFDGAILVHGFGQYVYIVPLSKTKFLVITGGEPGDPTQADSSLLKSLVRTISL